MMFRYVLLILASSAQAQTGFEPPQLQYPNLQRRLELTESQLGLIGQKRSAYQEYLSEKNERLNQVNRELLFERTRPEPDPSALGIRYYEIAAICQQSTRRLGDYKQDLRKVFTHQQAVLLDQLERELESLPAIAEAQDLNLLGAVVRTSLPSSPPIPVATLSWRVSQVYGGVALPGCPSNGLSGGIFALIGDFTPSMLYPNLIRHLGLTPEQIEQIQNATNRIEQDLSESRITADEIQRELQRESALPTPNPSLLGEKAYRLEQICRQSIALETAAGQAIPKLLTPTQRPQWAELERALQLLPALAESQTLRLNSRVPTNALPPFFLSTSLARRIEWTPNANSNSNLPGCQEATGFFSWFDAGSFVATKKPIFAAPVESK